MNWKNMNLDGLDEWLLYNEDYSSEDRELIIEAIMEYCTAKKEA